MTNSGVRPELRKCADAQAWAAAAANLIGDRLREAVRDRGAATLALSGGSTPGLVHKRLAGLDLPWSQVLVTLVDERCVPFDSPDSNARFVTETLLHGPAAAARLLQLYQDWAEPEAALQAVEGALCAEPMPFDVVVLGMGDDGHTASLFPGSPALDAAFEAGSGRTWLNVPAGEPAPPQARISMTLPAILAARTRLLLLRGAEKLAVYERALAGEDAREMPVRAVLHGAPMVVLWAA